MVYRRNERYVHRAVAGEHLLVALHKDRYGSLFALTPTGAEIWDYLAAWRTLPEIAERLISEFDVAEHEAHGDAEAFLNQLSSLGAVDIKEGPS